MSEAMKYVVVFGTFAACIALPSSSCGPATSTASGGEELDQGVPDRCPTAARSARTGVRVLQGYDVGPEPPPHDTAQSRRSGLARRLCRFVRLAMPTRRPRCSSREEAARVKLAQWVARTRPRVIFSIFAALSTSGIDRPLTSGSTGIATVQGASKVYLGDAVTDHPST